MAFKRARKLVGKMVRKAAARKKLRTYKKKVKASTKYKANKAGKLQKKIDIKAKKRSLGIGSKKRVQKKINKLYKKRNVAKTKIGKRKKK